MKFIKQGLFLLVFLLTVSIPITTYAAGEGNIDHGGGMLGEGTGINFWSSHDEGVRVTVVRASDGAVVSASIDLTNKQPTDIRVHFGKVSKTAYRNGTGLSACMGGYTFYNPAQHLPQIISTSNGGANLTAIKQYFTDEQVIRAIAGYVGMDFQTLVNGEYKLLLEPVAYVTFEGVRTAFTATEAAKYNQLRGGMIRKKMPSLSHKNLPLAMFLEISDLGYPAWSGSRTEKAGDEDIIRALGLGIVRFNETITPEVIQADYTYRVDTDVITAVTVSGDKRSGQLCQRDIFYFRKKLQRWKCVLPGRRTAACVGQVAYATDGAAPDNPCNGQRWRYGKQGNYQCKHCESGSESTTQSRGR